MRFLFFNIVVGAALLYLYNGGDLNLSTFVNKAKSTTEVVAQKAAPIESLIVAENPPKPKSSPSGHARDVIEEPAPKPAPAPRKPKASSLPAIKNPVTIAKYVPKKPNFGDTQKAESPEIAKRRAEVFGEPQTKPAQKFALKEGSNLMSVSERRQALDDLAEEMEMLFLEKIGG